MGKFTTIHVFAYGEAQIIGKDLNFKSKISNFKKLQAVIDDIKSKKPADKLDKDYRAINIFSDLRADYNANEKDSSFNVKYSDLNETKINALVAEFEKLKADFDAANPPA